MNYEISIRINFPEEISHILQKEKKRFISEYGSKYKSEPHITLYRDRFTKEGFLSLIKELGELNSEAFSIELLRAKANYEIDRHRTLYVVDVSNKDLIIKLHNMIETIAVRYRDCVGRKDLKVFDPHITLGAIDLEAKHPDLMVVRENIKNVIGKNITVSSFSVALYGKRNGEEKFKLIEKIKIQLNNEA